MREFFTGQRPEGIYYQAARFEQEPVSAEAFRGINDILYSETAIGLSVIRFRQPSLPYIVTVLGEVKPPEDIERGIDSYLDLGKRTLLDAEIINKLMERREAAGRLGTWVERHADLRGPGFNL